MKSGILKYIASLLLLILLLNSCRKEKSYWDDDFVAPIARGNLTLGNLFPDTTLKSNPDSSLKIAFEASIINFQLDSLIKIPDTTIKTFFNLPVAFPVAITPGMSIPIASNAPTENYYNLPNGIQLKKAVIKQGGIDFVMKNTVYRPLIYHYQLLSATKNSKILDTVFKIPAADSASGVQGILPGHIDLTGYTIDFTGINHNKFNVTVEIDSVHIDPDTTSGFLYPNQGFDSEFSFKGLIPQYALGYFGNQSVVIGPDTTAFDVFKTIKSGILNLNSASINLKIVNELGVAMRTSINSLTSISTPNGTLALTPSNSTPLASPININSAINTGTGSIALTKTLTINSSAGNTPLLTTFIGNLPEKIAYKLTAQINPGGNQSGSNDFGYYGTGFRAYMDADIPLYFSASNLVLADTVTINLGSIDQFKNINHGQLILTATNGYPFSINLQGYLLDANKQVIDVLFNNPNTIQAPMLDINFKVIAPLQSKLTIPLTKDKLANLQKAKYIYYKSTFNTASQPNQIKFYSYYNLDLLLTADINYSIGK